MSPAPVPIPPPAPALAPEPHAASGGERLLPPGLRLGDGGRYRIVDIVAIGGMSTLYKAVDRRLGDVCALKAQHLSAACDAAEQAAFRREAALLASIHHPEIVRVRDFFIDGEYALLAMEFVEGENLYDRHRRAARAGEDVDDLPVSPVPEDQAAAYGVALAGVLEFLHARTPPLLYRDLKPHNVMRRAAGGGLALLDFGIARPCRRRGSYLLSDDLGTPGYAAPEQYHAGGRLDARTDIYSLGVLMAELATGYNPRAPRAARALPPVAAIGPRLTPSFAAILQRCTELDPERRYASAAALLAALRAWQRQPRALLHSGAPRRAWQSPPAPRVEAGGDGAAAGPPQLAGRGDALYRLLPGGAVAAVCPRTGARRAATPAVVEAAPATPAYRMSVSPAGWGGGARAAVALVARHGGGGGGSLLRCYDADLRATLALPVACERLLTAWCSGGAALAVVAEPGAAGPPDARQIIWLERGGDPAREWRCIARRAWPQPLRDVAACDGAPFHDLALLERSGVLRRVTSRGAAAWSLPLPDHSRDTGDGGGGGGASGWRRVAAIGAGLLAVSDGAGRLLAVDAASGRLLWRADGLGPLARPPLLAGRGRVYAATRGGGVARYDAATGSPAGSLPGVGAERPVVGLEWVAPGHAGRERAAGDNPGTPTPLLMVTEYGAGGRVLLCETPPDDDADAGERVVWSDAAPGGVAAPAAATGSGFAAPTLDGGVSGWLWPGAPASEGSAA